MANKYQCMPSHWFCCTEYFGSFICIKSNCTMCKGKMKGNCKDSPQLQLVQMIPNKFGWFDIESYCSKVHAFQTCGILVYLKIIPYFTFSLLE